MAVLVMSCHIVIVVASRRGVSGRAGFSCQVAASCCLHSQSRARGTLHTSDAALVAEIRLFWFHLTSSLPCQLSPLPFLSPPAAVAAAATTPLLSSSLPSGASDNLAINVVMPEPLQHGWHRTTCLPPAFLFPLARVRLQFLKRYSVE